MATYIVEVTVRYEGQEDEVISIVGIEAETEEDAISTANDSLDEVDVREDAIGVWFCAELM